MSKGSQELMWMSPPNPHPGAEISCGGSVYTQTGKFYKPGLLPHWRISCWTFKHITALFHKLLPPGWGRDQIRNSRVCGPKRFLIFPWLRRGKDCYQDWWGWQISDQKHDGRQWACGIPLLQDTGPCKLGHFPGGAGGIIKNWLFSIGGTGLMTFPIAGQKWRLKRSNQL